VISARSKILIGLATVVVAACGSSAATPTPAGGGGGGGGGGGATETRTTGQATAQATSGTAGGGGGGGGTVNHPAGWDRYGKVTYTISGPASASGELGFVPAGSVFAGSQVSLSYYDEGSNTIVALRFDGSNAFAQYGDGKLTFTSEQCTTRDLKASAPASGSFECTGPVIVESGAIMTGAKMTGTFSARP
jgi:hypothetical protein